MPNVFDIPEKITGQQCTAEEFNAIVAASSAFKVYVATFTQSGTGNPTAVVYNNTMGTFTEDWTRYGEGTYILTTAIPFVTDKCFIPGMSNSTNTQAVIPVIDSLTGSLTGYISVYGYDEGGFVAFELDVYDTAGSKADFSAILNGFICLPELRVYK